MWKSNYLNEITGDHANENYEVNMWGKYCRIYPEFAPKKQQQYFIRYNQYTKIDCLIAQDKMICKFYKIKCTAASDQVLNCQPKIVILNNMSLSY